MDQYTVPENKDLRELVYHTDARVTAMEGAMTNMASNLQRQDQKLDQVIAAINKPDEINWSGWAVLVFAVLASAFGLTMKSQEYTALSLAPVNEEVEQNHVRISDLYKSVNVMNREVGRLEAFRMQQEDITDVMREWQHRQDGDIKTLSAESATSEKDRETLHKLVEDLDRYGSRRWIKEDR